MIYVVMGVSGAGKTLIGKMLANKLGLPFFDGDDYHPEANVNKMASGEPLNDDDREPWLQELARNMKEWSTHDGAVLACSALKEKYREILRPDSSADVCFIFLKGEKKLIAERLRARKGHFMPPGLLDTQFKALEEPADAITVEADSEPDDVVDEILKKLGL